MSDQNYRRVWNAWNDLRDLDLDIEKYSEFFEADKSAMIVEELKLDRTNYKLGEIIKDYPSFFANKERREKLTKLIEQPESIDEEEFKLSILTVISGAKTVDILEIIKNIILNFILKVLLLHFPAVLKLFQALNVDRQCLFS